MKNATYDKAKWVALVALPALGALYFALAGIWVLPKPDEVVGTITVVDTFLGVLLHVSTSQYQGNGDLNVVTDPVDKGTAVQVAMDSQHPADLEQGQKVVLKVNKVAPPVA